MPPAKLSGRTSRKRCLLILANGALDYPDDVLATFDFVVASIHSPFKLDKVKTQTERLLCAIADPYSTILGHMTGRQLRRRPPVCTTFGQNRLHSRMRCYVRSRQMADVCFGTDCVAKLVSDLGASLALEFRRFFWYGVSAVSVLLVDFSTGLPVVAGDGRLAWPAASGSARWL